MYDLIYANISKLGIGSVYIHHPDLYINAIIIIVLRIAVRVIE